MRWCTWGTGGVKCQIAPGWAEAGREGEALGYFETGKPGGHVWVVVQWYDEDDPDLQKAGGLVFKHIGQRTFKSEKL